MQSLKTLTLIEELSTDGHSPLLFICNDMNFYYCKYRSGISLNTEEIDCLFYEIVAKNFLDKLGIPCPELAIVEISANSYDKKKLLRHKKFCLSGQLYLGSKGISGAEDLHGLSAITNKRAFNRILNPYDLLRIAIFDLWIDNCDRGRTENYNLLNVQRDQGIQFLAFDHAFCFGGLDGLRIFNSLRQISSSNKLISSSYFRKLLPYLNKAHAIDIVTNFLSLQYEEIEAIIVESYNQCPLQWRIPEQLKERMVLFLTNENRISQIKNLVWSLFK